MDYERIYRDFIADRKAIEHTLEGYTERHHIVPRSLGGGDEPENLVRLTARDHYFAHCCLAKIYGGKMWSALFAIAHMTKIDGASKYFSKRRMVSACREMAAKQRSENMRNLWASGEFKRNRVYTPITDAHRSALSAAASGRVQKPEWVERAKRTRQARAARFEFVHECGERFVGTAAEFRLHSGVSQPMISHLTRRKISWAGGWVLSGSDHRSVRGRNPLVLTLRRNDGMEFTGTMYEFRNTFSGIDAGSLSKLVAGRLGSVKGWRLQRN